MEFDKSLKYRRVIEGQRAVLLWDQWAWVVQGIDHDLASSGETPDEAESGFAYSVLFYKQTDVGKQAGGVEAVIAPPHEYVALWGQAV